jgi:nucleoside-diphosphate-sugar epimerase
MIGPSATDAVFAGRRIAVLGASGFIGRWVARALVAQRASLYLLVRDRARAAATFETYGIDGEIMEVDLNQPGRLAPLLQEIRPSATFNLSGYGVDPTEREFRASYRINAQLPDELCEAVAPVRDRLWPGQDIVHVGSALEYGAVGGTLVENTRPNPTTLYGRSKLAGTRRLGRRGRALGVKCVTARLFTVYGPGEHAGRLLPSLLDAANRSTPLALTAGRQQRDFTYVEDVAERLLQLACAAAPPGQIVNLATGRLTTVRTFAEIAGEILGIEPSHLQFGMIPTRAEEMEHAVVSVERLRQLVGDVPSTCIAEGIRETVGFLSALAPR